MVNEEYLKRIKSRSLVRFCIGIIPRLWNFVLNSLLVNLARLKGAKIGRNSSITLKLALKANSNLVIGENSIVESSDLDLRQKIVIGNNVIINKKVVIIRQSHRYDSPSFETIGFDLKINDYTWITTNSLILPSCKTIGRGAILAAGSVLTKDMNDLDIFGGNPAKFIKKREEVHYLIFNPALQGRDIFEYIKAWYN